MLRPVSHLSTRPCSVVWSCPDAPLASSAVRLLSIPQRLSFYTAVRHTMIIDPAPHSHHRVNRCSLVPGSCACMGASYCACRTTASLPWLATHGRHGNGTITPSLAAQCLTDHVATGPMQTRTPDVQACCTGLLGLTCTNCGIMHRRSRSRSNF